MVLATGFENIISLAWQVGYGSIALSGLLFGSIISLRYYKNFRDQETITFRNQWEPLLIESLDEIPSNLPKLKRREHITLLLLWNYVQEVLRDESKENLELLGKQLNLIGISQKLLKKFNAKHKLIALNTLGWIKDEKSKKILLEYVNHSETAFSFAAARALARMDKHEAIPLILPLIAERIDWSNDICAELLGQTGCDDITEDLIAEIYRTPKHLLPKMIRFLDFVLPTDSNEVIKYLLKTHKDKEIIIACLNVYQNAEDLKTIRRFLTHKDWEVRMQAAVCLGKLGSPNDIPRLTAATRDPEWWVRYRSAQSLAKLPRMTNKKLTRIANRASNSFSQDVILRVVSEKEVAESCGLTY